MSNKEIIRSLKLTAQLMELHGEDQFKTRSYTNAIFNLEKTDLRLEDLKEKELQDLEGIGKSIASKITALNATGSFKELDAMLTATPPGVVKMLGIKGLGPKKLRTIWQTLEIEDLDSLMKACEAGQVAKLKGFGAKTEASIIKVLEFTLASEGFVHYRTAEPIAASILESLEKAELFEKVTLTGEMALRREVVSDISFVASCTDFEKAEKALDDMEHLVREDSKCGPLTWRGHTTEGGIQVCVRMVKPQDFANKAYQWSATAKHLNLELPEGGTIGALLQKQKFETEEALFEAAKVQPIPAELREGDFEMELAKAHKLPGLLEYAELKGAMHNHSTYSDGKHTLREMAVHARDMGLEYFGISDHSKAAFYANGLEVERVRKQWEEIDALNKEMAPFRIFKGIESDILNDGSLDYADEVLAGFDYVVASVHSNLDMKEDKATQRLITAIENPYTTMLGHPTGRLLLRRQGYPLDFKKVIDACAANKVIIEINANPWRLDLDWRHVRYALDKGVMLSINPDAHDRKELANMRFGVIAGRKGGLTAAETFNALSLKDAAAYLDKRKAHIAKGALA